MINNTMLWSCDQAVRQAGGLVLELWVALIDRVREEGKVARLRAGNRAYIYSAYGQGA